MIIRAAQVADAPAMGRVMVDTYLRAHKGQIPEEVWRRRQEEWTYAISEAGWARTLQTIADGSLPRSCIYVAVEMPAQHAQGEVIGLIMGGPSEIAGWEHAGDIYALYVRFEHHGCGVGRRLVLAAANHLAGLGMTELIIRSLPANTAANHFYEALGGQIAGECETEEYSYRIVERIYHWQDSSSL